MKLIVTHPFSNMFNREVIYALHRRQMLLEFNTTIACFPNSVFARMSHLRLLKEFNRRNFELNIEEYTRTWPWFELARHIAPRLGLHQLCRHEKGIFSPNSIYTNLDKRVSRRLDRAIASGATGIYAYEEGAVHSFRAAKAAHLKTLYDLPIGYWRTAARILDEEKFRNPQWISTIPQLYDSTEKLHKKDEELELADEIFVASTFTKSTLEDYPKSLKNVHIIPYGFPPTTTSKKFDAFEKENRKLKVLYVGGLTQRKGIADVFTAVKGISRHVSLTVVGQKGMSKSDILEKELRNHEWISSLPHSEVLKTMREHDVLVFPSLFEGFGQVITEAMSQGTPVITTDRTGGADIINHGKNGWIVPAGDPTSLQDTLAAIIDDPQSLAMAGSAALSTAKERPWQRYGNDLANVILSLKNP